MLQITIPASEMYDERAGEFIATPRQVLQVEHSLVSLAKWESRWGKPFLTTEAKSRAECNDYIRCMTLTQNVPPNVYKVIPESVFEKVNDYIEHPMTATWFRDDKTRTSPKNREVITAEIIYYWMIALNIPFECQKWHLSRLLTLIRVCEAENRPKKKASKQDLLSQYASLNAARRKPRR